jgi:hypothetical protein
VVVVRLGEQFEKANCAEQVWRRIEATKKRSLIDVDDSFDDDSDDGDGGQGERLNELITIEQQDPNANADERE